MDRFLAQVEKDLEILVPNYLKGKKQDVSRIKQALTHQAFEEVQRIAHPMKGSGTSYGFEYITLCGVEIEEAAKSHQAERIQEWTEKLDYYLEHVEIHYVDVEV